jgi:transcriptional regulator with XRE-family HTH domain
VYVAAEISRRLIEALDGRSKADVAAEIGIARSTIYDIVKGETWPDIATLVSLEELLDASLWPRWAPGARGPDA